MELEEDYFAKTPEISGRELREFVSENSMFIRLTDPQCESILKMIRSNAQTLTASHTGQLYFQYEDNEGLHMSATNIDDVIDMTFEISYERFSNAKERVLSFSYDNFDGFEKAVVEMNKCESDYNSIKGAFEQTKYCQTSMRQLIAECLRIDKIEKEKKEMQEEQLQEEDKEKAAPKSKRALR